MHAGKKVSLEHLLRRLDAIILRVEDAIDRCRTDDPGRDDPARGLYLPDEHIDRLLARPTPAGDAGIVARAADAAVTDAERWADAAQAAGGVLRLRRLAADFGLTPLDIEALLVALAPDVDARLESFYGYLNDDVTRRRATIGLVLELCDERPWDAAARRRLAAGGALVDAGLLVVEEPERPFLTRSLRVPDPVAAHLLGDDRVDPDLHELVVEPHSSRASQAHALARAVRAGARLAYVRERRGGDGLGVGAAVLAELATAPLVLDLTRLRPAEDIASVAACACRQARLVRGGVVAGPTEALADRGHAAVTAFAELPVPVVLTGRLAWDPSWSRSVPAIAEVAPPDRRERAAAWRASVNGDLPAGEDAGAVTAHLRLARPQIVRAAAGARWRAAAAGRTLSAADLLAAARSENSTGLERLGRRIEPRVTWSDLVLSEAALRALTALAGRARHRERVLCEWSMRGQASTAGEGITALFAGPSGTGKTLAAEVLAGDLGLELYAVDLATVVDKYVGETEKNLDRIFTEAAEINALLFFDEADALFGRRSDVRDAHDRYANIEVAYLLQRMEFFDGIAVLATNLRANVDEAFTRRLDAIVDFGMPDAQRRLRLWELCLGTRAPCAADLDLDFCAAAFELSGGSIRSIALAAAYEAAARDDAIRMDDVILAVEQEYRKLGRLCSESEFGPWYQRIRA